MIEYTDPKDTHCSAQRKKGGELANTRLMSVSMKENASKDTVYNKRSQ